MATYKCNKARVAIGLVYCFAASIAATAGTLAQEAPPPDNPPYNQGNPNWSPDGRQIAFSSSRDGAREIYTIELETHAISRLTNNEVIDTWPVWSPDGKWIAYASGPAYPNLDIMLMRPDGSEKIRLRENVYGGLMSWSADQTKLAFYGPDTGENSGNWDLYVLDIEARTTTRLTDDPAEEQVASWSNDGSQLLYQSDADGDQDLYLLNVANRHTIKLTHNEFDDAVGRWSPDGEKIAFESMKTGDWNIFTMEGDGSNIRQLTDDPAIQVLSAWSPDGSRIAYESTEMGYWDVFTMNADGSGKRKLMPR